MKFSPQQQSAFDKIMQWYNPDADETTRFVLAGYAGTGKSTLAAHLAKEFEKVVFCAYTGKAANVLRSKGCKHASTIHGAIYTLIEEDEKEPRYVLNEDSDIAQADLVIVDEYSMLSKEIISDLESVATHILYLGDPFQLPPVNGENILQPDFFLEEIHRQALESSILKAATDVREGRVLSFQQTKEFSYLPKSKVTAEEYEAADQIIVGYNDTRKAWNKRFREKLGFADIAIPQKGDKLICTKNNKFSGLFNGMIGEAENDAKKTSFNEITFEFEGKKVKVFDANFYDKEQPPVDAEKKLERFDYAYAITAHKAQGSEFDNVLIYNQPIGKDSLEKRRWTYTAITRAKEKCILVQP